MTISGSGIVALEEAGVPVSTSVKRLLTANLKRANHNDNNELSLFVLEAMIRQFESPSTYKTTMANQNGEEEHITLLFERRLGVIITVVLKVLFSVPASGIPVSGLNHGTRPTNTGTIAGDLGRPLAYEESPKALRRAT